jgi:DNA-binding CsgD family transcriptional regulator
MNQSKLYLTFGLGYSVVIGFLLYGPLMEVLATRQGFIYTVVSLLAFIMAFLYRGIGRFSKKIILGGLGGSTLVLGICLVLCKASTILMGLGFMLFAFFIATICRCFTLQAVQVHETHESEKVIAFSFFIAFSILYGLNIFKPITTPVVGFAIIVFLTLLIAYYFKMQINMDYTSVPFSKTEMKPVILPLIALYLIYIGGGVSYVGIYPHLSFYQSIDRFYNVFPLLVALPLSVKVEKSFGYMANLVLGILALSLSFGFFLLPSSVLNYFIVQTCLQVGWGFMNVFGFSYSWRLAKDQDQPHIFGYGILFILMGVASGSVVANSIVHFGLPVQYYGLITFVPIVVSLIFLFSYQDRQKEQALMIARQAHEKVVTTISLDQDKFNDLEVLSDLTKREKEVIYLYYRSESAAKIAEKLHISQNTVRSHIKKAYVKLEVNKRDELKNLINRKL